MSVADLQVLTKKQTKSNSLLADEKYKEKLKGQSIILKHYFLTVNCKKPLRIIYFVIVTMN